MSEKEFLFSIFIGLIAISLSVTVLSVVHWYRMRRNERVQRAMGHLRGKNLPSVTVLVYAHNQQAVIEETLQTLRANRYRAADIVVIDDASIDQTSKKVKQFCTRYPKAAVRLLRRRKRTTVSEALRAGYQNSCQGEIILTITADQVADEQTIKRAVAMQGRSGVWRVPLDCPAERLAHLADIGQRLEQHLWHQQNWMHAYTSTHFLDSCTVPSAGVRSDGDVVGALSVLCAGVLIAGSVATFGVQALWYVWVGVVSYGLAVVWMRFDDRLNDKFITTFALPLALFLIPSVSFVRGFSQLGVRK